MTAGADFSQIFGSAAFLSEPLVVVAVSGGSDSTALLFHTKEKVSPATRLVAVTVDHGLRPESPGEAAAVARLCAAQGIEHQIVRWEGAKPATGLQAAARLARYDLLAKATLDLGGRLVLTGHTADDQAETISMRMQRGEGLGLAGIAPLTLYDRKVWFARPQLGERRAVLREWLRDRGFGWIDDPSNSNAAFERVRVRSELSMLSDREFARLIETGTETAAARIGLGRRAARLIERSASLRSSNAPASSPSRGGGKMIGTADAIVLELQLLEEDAVAAVHALRILLAVVGGTEQLPDRERTEALFKRLHETDRGRFSLTRTVIAKRRGEVLLTREQRGKSIDAGEVNRLAMRSPWDRLLPCFDLDPARVVDELLGKTTPPALPWP